MRTQFQEAFDDLNAFVKSREGDRRSFSAGSQDDEGDIHPLEQLRTCKRMLERLDTPEGQKGMTTAEVLSWRNMIRQRIEQLQERVGDTTELEVVGKSLGFGMAMGSRAAGLGVQIAQNYLGRVSPEFLAWFARNPMGA